VSIYVGFREMIFDYVVILAIGREVANAHAPHQQSIPGQTYRAVLRSICLSFLGILGFRHFQGSDAAVNPSRERQVSAAPAGIRAGLVAKLWQVTSQL